MTWVINNLGLIWSRSVDHVAIAFPAVILSFLIALPIGWLATRFAWSRGILLSLSSVLYAIPSLPLFIVLPLLIGTGLRDPINLVVALTLYGIALMVRSTADGLSSVDGDIVQSATAIGYSAWSRFWRVELPLAGPVLLAGIRVVSVSTVSLTTVGAVLGISGTGVFFTDGVQRNIPEEILTGVVVTIVIAVVFDLVIVQVGRLLLPWTRAMKTARARQLRDREGVTA